MSDVYYIFVDKGAIAVTKNDFGVIVYEHVIEYKDPVDNTSVVISVADSYRKLGDIQIIMANAKDAYELVVNMYYYEYSLPDNGIISIDILREIGFMYEQMVYPYGPTGKNAAVDILNIVRHFVNTFESFDLAARTTMKALTDDV